MKTRIDPVKGTLNRTAQGLLLSMILVGSISIASAAARVVIEIAPPPPRVEVIPVMRTGYTWALGYWDWQHNKHVWVDGHSMRVRKGYDWSPDRWTQVSNGHELEHGHWTRHTEHGQ